MSHAIPILQPSAFKRTIECPGWGGLCTKHGLIQPESKWAIEGSAAHFLADRCVSAGINPALFAGQQIWQTNDGNFAISTDRSKIPAAKITITDDMVAAVKVYTDEISRQKSVTIGAQCYSERRVDLSWLVPGMFGTVDYHIIEPMNVLYVTDYKHGAGVVVEVGEKPGDNVQTSIYALAALGENNRHMVGEVISTIVQPRAPHPAGPVRSIKYDVEDLYAWGRAVVVPAARAAMQKDAPLKAGPWCRFCPASSPASKLCPEIVKQMAERANIMFPSEDQLLPAVKSAPPDPVTMTGEALDRFLDFADVFDSLIKAVKNEAYQRLLRGAADAPIRYKLVAGRLSTRAWAFEGGELLRKLQEHAHIYEADLFDYAPKSPAKVEQLLKKGGYKAGHIKELFEPLLGERKPGNPTLAPIDDPRPALPPTAELMFGQAENSNDL